MVDRPPGTTISLVSEEVRASDGEAAIGAALRPLLAAPADAAVLLDLDGTLSPIVARPEQSEVPARTRGLVESVAAAYGLAAVISGRRATEARRILGIEGITYVGNHGYELLPAGAAEAKPAPALAGHERDVADFLAAYDATGLERAGVRLENKAAIIALHWRDAPEPEQAETAAALAAAEAEGAGLYVHRGRKVIELRPAVRTDKGRAVESLLTAAHFVTGALYAGDDRTDVDAFRALRRMSAGGRLRHAVCVGVVSDESPPEVALAADLTVQGPEGFLDVLGALA
jgi:trehalose 6-phosphate phosphatase